jgi:hypothetical protein
MNLQLVASIVLFLISQVLAFAVQIINARIINAINDKRRPMPQIDLLSKETNFFSILDEYKRLCPEGRLHILLFGFGFLSILLFVISGILFSTLRNP